ncbi:MAG: four helix bundle protein [Chthoniobacterales bacterium]
MKNDLETRTRAFALSVIHAVGKLSRSQEARILGRQLLRSGTSIGANYREANRAESHDDFIHKIALFEKEAAESGYWIELIVEAGVSGASTKYFHPLSVEARELLAIFVASGRTAKLRSGRTSARSKQ